MEIHKLNYDDFYKFGTSFGVLILIISFISFSIFSSQEKTSGESLIISEIIIVFSIITIVVISILWYHNKQSVLDDKEKQLLERMKIENDMFDFYRNKLRENSILSEEFIDIKNKVDELYYNKKTIKQDWESISRDDKDDE